MYSPEDGLYGELAPLEWVLVPLLRSQPRSTPLCRNPSEAQFKVTTEQAWIRGAVTRMTP